MSAPRLFGPAEPGVPMPSETARLLGGSFAAAVGGDPNRDADDAEPAWSGQAQGAQPPSPPPLAPASPKADSVLPPPTAPAGLAPAPDSTGPANAAPSPPDATPLGMTVGQLTSREPSAIAASLRGQATKDRQPDSEADFAFDTPVPVDPQLVARFGSGLGRPAPRLKSEFSMEPEEIVQGLIKKDLNPDQLNSIGHTGLPDYVDRVLGIAGIGVVGVRHAASEYAPYRDYENAVAGGRPDPQAQQALDTPGVYFGRDRKVILALDGPYGQPGGGSREGSVDMNRHEKLHGFDVALGNLSGSSAFMAAWAADNGKLGPPSDPKLYSTGPGRPLGKALRESFAESGARYFADPKQFRTDAPNLYAYWSALDRSMKAGIVPGGAPPPRAQ